MKIESFQLIEDYKCDIRRAEAADKDQLFSLLELRAQEDEYSFLTSEESLGLIKRNKDEWAKNLSQKETPLFYHLALIENEVVGLLETHLTRFQKSSHVAEILFYVKPDWRGFSIASCLAEIALEDLVNRKSIMKVVARVSSQNHSALNICAKLGFREEGRRIREIKNTDGTFSDVLTFSLWLQ